MLKNDRLDAVQLGLLDEGIVGIGGEVDQDMALYVREAMHRLLARRITDVEVHITSGGGKIAYGLDIYDMLRLYPGRVTGVVYGVAISSAAIILQGCAVRQSARHATIKIHNVSVTDIKIDELMDPRRRQKCVRAAAQQQERIVRVLRDRTHQPLHLVRAQCRRDESMTAEEALKFGLIDEII